ncbi:DNA-processing protein DprA [Elusimicrobiota bacterium]
MDSIEIVLQILSIDGVGRIAVKRMLDHFKKIEDLFQVTAEELSAISGLNMHKCRQIIAVQDSPDINIKTQLKKTRDQECLIYMYGTEQYPRLLAQIYDPPIVFYARGQIKDVDYNAVAIVGTRRASEYGKNAAKLLAKQLAVSSITVISGCAVGIDTYAHRGALKSSGRTIAVLGSGLNAPYPVRNIGLMKEISENGSVISEFPLDTKPVPYNFPLRNRIISGLSRAVVVVEAPSRSGALITAYGALEQGREVYSVPGSIFSSRSKGCVELIKNGAMPVSDAKEIIRDLEPLLNKDLMKKRNRETALVTLSERSRKVLDSINDSPVHVDIIKNRTKLSINTLIRELTNLEILGRITQVSGKRYLKNG